MTTFLERLNVVTPANRVPGPEQGNWDYNAYAALPDDGLRYEVVGGVLYVSPAPKPFHQKVVGKINRYLGTYIEDAELGEVFVSPIDVELTAHNIVQSDVVVVLQEGQANVTETRIVGPPDLVVEVSSPSTAGHDRREKQDAYAHAGITEYWIVDAAAHTAEVLLLQDQAYQSQGVFSGEQAIPSKIVPAIENVPVTKFFC